MPWQAHRNRTGCQLCYPLEERRLLGPHRNAWHSWPVGTQPKLNGERARFIDGFLLSSTEQLIYSVPHILAELDRLNPPFELDGELYLHSLTFEDIHSIVSREVNLHPNHKQIEYHIFDIASDDKDFLQIERSLHLHKWFSENVDPSSPLKLVNLDTAENYEHVLNNFDSYVSQSYEGIIVRHLFKPYKRSRSTFCLKFKPKQQDDYLIIGFDEEHDKNGLPKNRLGCLHLRAENGNEFSVYSGFDDKLRDYLWLNRETLTGRFLTVYYQALTSDRQVPCFGRVNAKKLKLQWSIN